jgi:hypothetical protein
MGDNRQVIETELVRSGIKWNPGPPPRQKATSEKPRMRQALLSLSTNYDERIQALEDRLENL